MTNSKTKLQKIILSIVDDIVKICDDNKIDYYIIGGSLLGAVRHKGFIPWDDDFDIAMKRADYDKFINICREKLNTDKYFIQTSENELYYAFAFGKIRLKNTVFVEEFSKNVPINNGIFVDVFPIDNLPNSKFKRKIYLIINHILKNAIWIKCGYGTEQQRNRIINRILKVAVAPFSISVIKKMRRNLLYKYDNSITSYGFLSDYPNEIIKNKLLNNKRKYKFDDRTYYSILEYDEYLRTLYGNYMVLPPESDRITHYSSDIDFGAYDNEGKGK